MAGKTAEILSHLRDISPFAGVVPASRLEVQSAPEMAASGIPQLDALTGGFARGQIIEICGPASSGRTSILLCALARATQRGEVCALVDASDAFNPSSAAAAGMEMNRLLWVRCQGKYPPRRPPSSVSLNGNNNRNPAQQRQKRDSEFGRWESPLAQMLKVTDLLLQSNGFGMIALDLGDIPAQSARRIPLASWFRFRRVIENTPTVLLVLEQQPMVGSCSAGLIKVSALSSAFSGNSSAHSSPPHAQLLDQFEITAELLRSRPQQRAQRKPVQSTARFQSRAAWAG